MEVAPPHTFIVLLRIVFIAQLIEFTCISTRILSNYRNGINFEMRKKPLVWSIVVDKENNFYHKETAQSPYASYVASSEKEAVWTM